jgi:hypothetical protein
VQLCSAAIFLTGFDIYVQRVPFHIIDISTESLQ